LLRMLAFEPDRIDVNDPAEKKTVKSTKSNLVKTNTHSEKSGQSSAAQSSVPQIKQVAPIAQTNQSAEPVSNSVLSTAQASTLVGQREPEHAYLQEITGGHAIQEATKDESLVKPIHGQVSESAAPKLSLVQPTSTKEEQQKNSIKSKPVEKKIPEAKKKTLSIANWISYYQGLPLKGAVRQLAKHCVVASQQGNELHLLLDEDVAPMLSESLKSDLQAAISMYEESDIQLIVSVGQVDIMTPAVREKQDKEALPSIIEKSIKPN